MKNIRELVSQSTAMPVGERLALHTRLLHEARRQLPSFLQERCLACWLTSRQQAVIVADGAEFASQLRFFVPTLLDSLQKHTSIPIRQVVIRIGMPEVDLLPRQAQRPVNCSQAAARAVAEGARGCTAPDLSAALYRLAAAIDQAHAQDDKGKNRRNAGV